MDIMDVEISQATLDDKPVLRNMLELYLYDLSVFDGADLNSHGEFGYGYLDHYWREEGRHPFLVRVGGRLAGFVLVNTHCEREESHFSMAELFVMKKYRKTGIGRKIAFHAFDQFRGVWEVGQLPENEPATSFWQHVIAEYTQDDFEEAIRSDGGPLLIFDNRGRGKLTSCCS